MPTADLGRHSARSHPGSELAGVQQLRWPTRALPDRGGGSAPEQGEDGEHPAVQVWGGFQAELAEQLCGGRLDGSFADL
jgi:hypothetical protein